MMGASPGGMVPAFAGYAERVRDSFARQGAMALIGASIVDVGAGYCSVALVPRPDSETLIAFAVESFAGTAGPRRILDLGTGPGTLLLAALDEWPKATGLGVDASESALIYARRNAAVAQERTIKESELSTEIAVEEKKRQIRETQMAAEIAVEQQKSELLKQRVENEKQEADSKAYALTALLDPIKGMDWRMLMSLTSGRADARTNIAMAFRDLAENASKIGELNISPDLLSTLLEKDGKGK